MHFHRRSIILCALVPLLVAPLWGCDGDDPVGSGGSPELLLGTMDITGSGTGPLEPPSPLVARVEFGVQSDPPDYSQSDYPQPLLFSDHVMTSDDVGEAFSFGIANTAGFGVVAARLTDGFEEEVYFAIEMEDVFSSGTFGGESLIFEYNPEIVRSGPDFDGHSITRMVIVLNALSVTAEPNDRWRTDYSVEIRIMGRAH